MLARSLLPALALAASASTALAASSSALDLSATCQTSMVKLIGSDFGNCADIIGLAGLFGSSGSVVEPLDSWLDSVCSQDCSAAALANASAIIGSGCAADITAGAAVAVGLEVVTQNYTLFRNTLCLEKAPTSAIPAAGDYCVSSLLGAVQTATGAALNSTALLSYATGGVTALLGLFGVLPASAICTDCVHAIFTEVGPLIGAYAGLGASVLDGECGGAMNFSDGAISTGVVEAAVAGASATAQGTAGQAAVATSGAGVVRGAWAVVGVAGAAVAGLAVLL